MNLRKTIYPGRLAGWRSKRIARLDFFKCPSCGNRQACLLFAPDNAAACDCCGKRFLKEKFPSVRVKRWVAKCAGCGADAPLTDIHANAYGYACPNCRTYVGTWYGNRIVNPQAAIRLSWNPTFQLRSEHLSQYLFFGSCTTTKDFLVVRLLQALAGKDDASFMLFDEKSESSAALYFDGRRRKYLGFLVWNVWEKHAVLRQLFTVPDERRKGYAGRIVDFWVKNYADKVANRSGIESPNDEALRLHLKLGHIKREGESFTGVKCFIVPGM